MRELPFDLHFRLGERDVHLVHGSPRKVNEYLFEDKPARLYERLAGGRDRPGARLRPHPQAVGARATAASCSSTAARSASPRTATRAPRSRSCGPAATGIEVTIERVAYDAEAVAREVAAVGLPVEYADKLLIAA